MKQIKKKAPYIRLDGFNSVRLKDHQHYIKILGWLSEEEFPLYLEEARENDPFKDEGSWPRIVDMDSPMAQKSRELGMPVDVRETPEWQFIEHGGQEYFLISDENGNEPKKPKLDK